MVTKGQIYKLGEHRLMCGDSINDDISKLFERGGVRLICTDPPYGVAYVENKKHIQNKGESQICVDRKIENDQLQTKEEYSTFTAKWLKAVVPYLDSYNAIYIFNADMMFCALRQGMEKAGFYYSQLIIWVKNTVVLGRKDYLPMHELIAYGWYGRHKFERPKEKSVIFHPKPTSSKLHPTMKPVELIRKLILNSTKIGEGVYDPFGGSGTTLIACEHLKRKCHMVEFDPLYCETIIKRWEKLTGLKAELIN